MSPEIAPEIALVHRVRLNLTGRVGSRLAERLCARLGAVEKVFHASRETLLGIPGVGPVLAQRLLDPQLPQKADREMDQARERGWTIDVPGSEGFPPLLEETYDPPLLLYRKGEIRPGDGQALAVVGARRATPYGSRQAGIFAEELAAAGWSIVSGLARGVDTAAHRGALAAGGHTVAVLGTGLDVTYPPENASLVGAICDGGGAVVTEFPRGTPPLRENFPRRNRVISGISRGVVVIEASRKSGALITARWAAEENREVFALPGSIETGRSRGCHRLIQDGARIVEMAGDVLEEMGTLGPTPGTRQEERPAARGRDRAILDLLGDGEMTVDEIGAAADLRPSELALGLLRLEMAGAVRQFPGKRFSLAGRRSGAENP